MKVIYTNIILNSTKYIIYISENVTEKRRGRVGLTGRTGRRSGLHGLQSQGGGRASE